MDSLACTQPAYAVNNRMKVPLAQCLQTLDALTVPLYVAALTETTPILPWHWLESLGEERDTLVDLSWSATTVQMGVPDSLVGSIFIYHPEQLFRICQVGRPRRVCLCGISSTNSILTKVIQAERQLFRHVDILWCHSIALSGGVDTATMLAHHDVLEFYRIAQADDLLVLNERHGDFDGIDHRTGVAIQFARHLKKRLRWYQEHLCSASCLCQVPLDTRLTSLFPASSFSHLARRTTP